ncbi:MAG TPA: MmcQ/YjbR family DNA-binding protein [Acidimicrobiales bacterium]|nr:MmcQ/YjbR family DNA-binding protein [Acidimicrobiales bacterium]
MNRDRPELERLRAICPALPEVTERLSHGSPAWFVRGRKTVDMYLDDHHGDGRLAIRCLPEGGAQEAGRAPRPRLSG